MNRPDVAEKHLFIISIITESNNCSCPRRMKSFNFCPVELKREIFKGHKRQPEVPQILNNFLFIYICVYVYIYLVLASIIFCFKFVPDIKPGILKFHMAGSKNMAECL